MRARYTHTHNEGLRTCGPRVVDGVGRVLDLDQKVLYEGEIHGLEYGQQLVVALHRLVLEAVLVAIMNYSYYRTLTL